VYIYYLLLIYLLPSGAARRHLYCLSLRTGRLYDWGGTPGACSDISDTEHAYSRNKIADVILNNSVSFARTWELDIESWKNHIGNDCTHYCNPSDNTINWGVEVLKTIAAQRSKPLEQNAPAKPMQFVVEAEENIRNTNGEFHN
jgi:hypothetical protein